ncbi:MAG TPA: Ig-like domain-containing protein [Candidatus Limnocylindrales bacterium]|jgi:hypothetical protein|nr:Ig-like domain-containing protein [Candidatus Limnocylindrales bacterium]
MTTHDRARELAAISIDFDLDPADRLELDEHLAGCESCRTFAASVTANAQALSQLPAQDAPADLRLRVADAATDPIAASRDVATRRPAQRRTSLLTIPTPYRRPALMVAVAAAIIVAVVGTSLAWRSGPSGPDRVAGTSPTPASSGPRASGEPPVDLPVPEWAAVAELVPTDGVGPVVSLASGFRLASLDGTPPADLAKRLSVEPKIDFAVAPEPDGKSVRITPTAPLEPGAVYRFSLASPTGELLDSWAFQAKQPVRIVSTLPGDRSTDVPIDTGIEITFDQDGVADAESHVTIEPATKGRFEEHGRVLAFIPDALKFGTIYTVTVTKGIAVPATGETMAADVSFRFETAAKSQAAAGAITYQFQDDLFESAVSARPVIGLWQFGDVDSENPKDPGKTRIEVYRLPDLTAAIEAFRQVRASPRWARLSSGNLVPTAGLTRVLSTDADLNTYRGALWFSFPAPLAEGWYLIQHPSDTRPVQAILQVTDVAGYLAVSDTRTLVWANDMATGSPLSGATVSSDGVELGRTNAGGLLLTESPLPPVDESCAPGCPQVVVTVRTGDGRATFLPTTGPADVSEFLGGRFGSYGGADTNYWLLFHSDRTLYRSTDTINVYGMVKNRDSGAIPKDLTVQLSVASGDARPAVSTVAVKPGPTGTFVGSIKVADLPLGWYQLDLLVGSKVVGSTSFQVDRILKPAYRLEIETGRRVYLAGDQIRITVRAKFFDGSPVPGVPLRINGSIERDVVTDESGAAIVRTIATTEDEDGGVSYQSIQVSPSRAEEGEIVAATREFVVFPSSRTINAESVIRNGRVRVDGGVNLVDVDRLEREVGDGQSIWELDPRGKAVAGATVTVTFQELVPVRTLTGTEYDFIEKKVVPVYNYDFESRDAGTRTVKTDAKGQFAVSIPESGQDHDYDIDLSVSDADGHIAQATTRATSVGIGSIEGEPFASLRLTDPTSSDDDQFGVGDPIDLTMVDPETKQATGDGSRYLFYLAQRGIHEVSVQSSPRFVTTFKAWAPPNVDVQAVRFTGSHYVESQGYFAAFRQSDRRLDVRLSVASRTYAPGQEVTVNVLVRDAADKPVAASVLLRAVDEKLFSIGGAEQVDPLPELYLSLDAGIRSTYLSHRPPRPQQGCCDTGGGGGDERSDFRDTLLFESIQTGTDGRGSVSFKLSDDLTSWRVVATAITADLEAGEDSVQVPVGLPFFVDASIAPEYLAADKATIQVRTFGSALTTGSPVTISVASNSLGFQTKPIAAEAFENVDVPLPALTVGTHQLTISATFGSGASARTDKLTRSFVVVESRLSRARSSFVALGAGTALQGGDQLTTVVISDASAGRYLPLLVDLASRDGARLDRALAADLATTLLEKHYDSARWNVPLVDFSSDPYQTREGGMALLPYASADLELSALVAIVAPDHVDRTALETYLTGILGEPSETRERRMYALAGLAGLGSAVLPELQAAAADKELTIRERLIIGLGAAALGDAGTARSIERALADEFGEPLGQLARLRVGTTTADITAGTALMAVLAAATGDPRGSAYWAYVEANPSTEAIFDLDAAAYVDWVLARLPVQPASFAYTVGGQREVVELAAGDTFELTLTAQQRASLTLERLTGAIGVTTSWREPVAVAAFKPDPDVEISRTVTPSGTVGANELVRIDLTVSFGPQAADGCRQVTELVPSGLLTVSSLAAWIDPDSEEPLPDTGPPYAEAGQRVFFCAEPTGTSREAHLRYYARVVTPGDYVWEPAVVDSQAGPDHAAVTPQIVIKIR